MGEKMIVDLTELVAKFKVHLQPLAIGAIRTLKGIGKNEGKFMIIVTLSPERDLKITVDVNQMLTNKHYLDNIIENIYGAVEQSNKARFEKCRIMG